MEASYLNRTLRWSASGIVYTHDPKHAEAAQKEYGMTGAKSVSTPGAKAEEQDSDDKPLSDAESTSFRRAAATLNYLAQDRPDISYAVKECARAMSRPTCADGVRLKRVLRYLRGRPTLSQEFKWQNSPTEMSLLRL